MPRPCLRPPRRPARAGVLSALRPVLFVLLSAAFALLLLQGAMRLVLAETVTLRGPPWCVRVRNDAKTVAGPVRIAAVRASRGYYPLEERELSYVPVGITWNTYLHVDPVCDVRVVFDVGGKTHVFENVVRIGPEHDDPPTIVITDGPLVNGRPADEVR